MEMEMSDFDNDNPIQGYRSAEEKWARFCAFPDQAPVAKMPSLFPIPTHVVRRRMVKTIDAWRFSKLIYAPEYVFGQGSLLGRDWTNNTNLRVVATELTANLNDPIRIEKESGAWSQAISFTSLATTPVVTPAFTVFDSLPPLTGDVSDGGCRLLGAVMSIEYLGKIDNIEGVVEVAMNMNSQNSKVGSVPFSDMGFLSDDAINQAPYYKRFRLSEGIRTIWFPMDESRFEFEEPMAVLSRREFETAFPLDWSKDNRTFIVPTKHITGAPDFDTHPHFPGATVAQTGDTATVVKYYKLENDNLHSRARMEWHVNFVGLSGTTPVRVYIDQYYETIPHERSIDNYFPQKGPQGNSDVSTKIMHKLSSEVAVSSNARDTGFFSNALMKIKDYISPYVAPIMAGIAASRGMPMIAQGIMYGAGFSGRDQNRQSENKGYAMLPYSTR